MTDYCRASRLESKFLLLSRHNQGWRHMGRPQASKRDVHGSFCVEEVDSLYIVKCRLKTFDGHHVTVQRWGRLFGFLSKALETDSSCSPIALRPLDLRKNRSLIFCASPKIRHLHSHWPFIAISEFPVERVGCKRGHRMNVDDVKVLLENKICSDGLVLFLRVALKKTRVLWIRERVHFKFNRNKPFVVSWHFEL